jgi:hypothetical protein
MAFSPHHHAASILTGHSTPDRIENRTRARSALVVARSRRRPPPWCCSCPWHPCRPCRRPGPISCPPSHLAAASRRGRGALPIAAVDMPWTRCRRRPANCAMPSSAWALCMMIPRTAPCSIPAHPKGHASTSRSVMHGRHKALKVGERRRAPSCRGLRLLRSSSWSPAISSDT